MNLRNRLSKLDKDLITWNVKRNCTNPHKFCYKRITMTDNNKNIYYLCTSEEIESDCY